MLAPISFCSKFHIFFAPHPQIFPEGTPLLPITWMLSTHNTIKNDSLIWMCADHCLTLTFVFFPLAFQHLFSEVRIDWPNFDRPNFDGPNFDRPNFDRPNFDRSNFDRQNYDWPKVDRPKISWPKVKCPGLVFKTITTVPFNICLP